LKKFAAIVIGAGVAGSTAARVIAQAGWSVAIVEKIAFPRKKVCGEYLSSTNLSVLERLGILDEFIAQAGPEVDQVGLFDREVVLTSPMPRPKNVRTGWGRALRREVLDPMLLRHAVDAGTEVLQPCTVVGSSRSAAGFVLDLASKGDQAQQSIASRVVIAAHGSWEPGNLPTQFVRPAPRPNDLFGFKAHFRDAALPSRLMPLVIFPGGYGGMVTCDGGVASLSFCLRRDMLDQLRLAAPGVKAGEVAFDHIMRTCAGVQRTLAGATIDGGWLSAGPIRPGIRSRFRDGMFCVGNAAGEAQPLIAEGISIAIQSAWLMASRLVEEDPANLNEAVLAQVGQDYSRTWARAFAGRIRAANIFARIAMTGSGTHRLCLPLIAKFPRVLTLGARLSGKATHLLPPAYEPSPEH
jgi:flavin-dependent dehydrogenase